MRYLMTFSYDGSSYYGYQKQKDKVTIQEEIENKLGMICGNKKVNIHSSGRTDAHVHALNQKAHFDVDKEIDVESFRYSLNSLLDNSIYIKKIEKVNDDFHARYSVKEKCYIYKINLGEYNPMDRNYIMQYNKNLNIDSIKEAASYLVGEHDFKSFTKSSQEKENYTRTIYSIDIDIENEVLTFIFKGNGFLRYMVRNIVGTLINVGEGKILPSSIPDILNDKDRRSAGVIAEANGLYLYDVIY